MDSIHETTGAHYRYLDETYFRSLYKAFLAAFADYVMPFDLSEEQFRNHIVLNAVELDASVGCFDAGRMVGFTLNGFGDWNGRSTVYDAGTGVLPDFRRRGLSRRMFELMMPEFSRRGCRQYLLEVITSNAKAIALYKGLDFTVTRTLSLLHCPDDVQMRAAAGDDVVLREIDSPDWELLCTFWDGEPSWQNSTAAVGRSLVNKDLTGAFIDGRCVGYITYSKRTGRVAQFAVDPAYRRRGVGSRLLSSMLAATEPAFVPQVINIDRSIDSAMTFFENRGFTTKLSQHEMLRPI